MRKARRILKAYAFDLTGAQTFNVNLNPDNLTGVEALVIEAKLTTAATDSGDNVDIKLQETTDGVTYNTRARLAAWAGNLTVSAAAPERQRLNLRADGPMETTEEAYEPTGSAGAAEILANSVRNGPFVGSYRTAAGRQPGMRLSFVVTDAGSVNAHFVGVIDIWALSSV